MVFFFLVDLVSWEVWKWDNMGLGPFTDPPSRDIDSTRPNRFIYPVPPHLPIWCPLGAALWEKILNGYLRRANGKKPVV